MERGGSRRRGSRALLGALAAGGLLLASGAAARAAHPPADPAYEAQALDLLQRMSDAYKHLSALEQRTELRSSVMPLSTPTPLVPPSRPELPPLPPSAVPSAEKPDQVTRLQFEAPNRLRIEMESPDASGSLTLSNLCVSDGKFFWTYQTDKNLYTKEKAPGSIHAFTQLNSLSGGGLEMALLMGLDPFANMKEEMQSVRFAGEEIVDGTAAGVVVMQFEQHNNRTEMRLFIGKSDLLLRRMIVDTTPISRDDKPIKTGGPLDDLLDRVPYKPPPVDPDDPSSVAAPVDTPPGPPVKVRAVFNYFLTPAPSFSDQTFAYTPPKNAFTYGGPTALVKPRTFKQRLAEIARAVRRQKPVKPHTVRF